MANEARPIDASQMPDVSRLVREVARTGQPRVLHVDGDEARLSPTRRRKSAKAMSPAQFQAGLHATFGAWSGLVDADELKRELNELQQDDREPRTL